MKGFLEWRIGRYLWVNLTPIWSMSRKGFEELYEKISESKPSFEDVWRLTGGNPRILKLLYENYWSSENIIAKLIEWKKLSPSFINKWRSVLEKAIEDPDVLWSFDVVEEPVKEFVERNLIVYFLSERNSKLWVDEPLTEKDLEIGVGKYIAWQTSLHREAVKKALDKYK